MSRKRQAIGEATARRPSMRDTADSPDGKRVAARECPLRRSGFDADVLMGPLGRWVDAVAFPAQPSFGGSLPFAGSLRIVW